MKENSIGKRLYERRKELSLTQRQIADYVGVTEATVSRWESGEIGNMRRDKIANLARVLKVSPLLIMGLSDEIEQTDSLRLPKNRDETKLLDGYRALDDSKRQTLFSMLAFLSSPQGAGVGNITQNNIGNNRFLAVGNGNHYVNTVT